MTLDSDKKTKILEAALETFAQYGYRRTSMEDIARAAGVSRPALYLLFRNKEDLFRSLVERLHAAALDSARSVLSADRPFRERLTNALIVRDIFLLEQVHAGPHGAELLDVNMEMAADINRKADDSFAALVETAIRNGIADGTLSPDRTGVAPDRLAQLFLASICGAKGRANDVADVRKSAAEIAGLFSAVLHSD